MTSENLNLRKRIHSGVNESKLPDNDANSSFNPTLNTLDDGKHKWNTETTKNTSASEYAASVRQWIYQYHLHKNINSVFATFPFYSHTCSTGNFGNNPIPWIPSINNNTTQSATENTPVPTSDNSSTPNNVNSSPLRRGRWYKVPPLWKRVLAEFIDFVFLFLLKLSVMILTVEYVGGFDIERYDLDLIFSQELDYDKAYALTLELAFMEVLNRAVICIFEALCLRKGIGGLPGGMTPGKRMLGLRVVLCLSISSLGDDGVQVYPATDIGWRNAICRAVIKNFSLAIFFPVCFTVFFFQDNRAAYDIISNCIVIESNSLEWIFLRNQQNERQNGLN